jgi:GDPmannose 4,6-dehydratase
MMQQPEPDDYVLATGETHAVRDFIERAFAIVGRRIEWRGKGAEERGIDARTGSTLVQVDPRYFRPTEVDLLIGDPTKARERLGWKHSTSFDDLVAEMVEFDIRESQLEHRHHDKPRLRAVPTQWKESVDRRPQRDGRVLSSEAAGIRVL